MILNFAQEWDLYLLDLLLPFSCVVACDSCQQSHLQQSLVYMNLGVFQQSCCAILINEIEIQWLWSDVTNIKAENSGF
jgi:hypothetical protein